MKSTKKRIRITESQLNFTRLITENSELEGLLNAYNEIGKVADKLWVNVENIQIGDIDQSADNINKMYQVTLSYEQKLAKLTNTSEKILSDMEASSGYGVMVDIDSKLDNRKGELSKKLEALQTVLSTLNTLAKQYSAAKEPFQNMKKLEINT